MACVASTSVTNPPRSSMVNPGTWRRSSGDFPVTSAPDILGALTCIRTSSDNDFRAIWPLSAGLAPEVWTLFRVAVGLFPEQQLHGTGGPEGELESMPIGVGATICRRFEK